VEAAVVSCIEAGRDGFWLHRHISEHGVITHVVITDEHPGEPPRQARQNRSARCKGACCACWAYVKGHREVWSIRAGHRRKGCQTPAS
jgi:transposase